MITASATSGKAKKVANDLIWRHPGIMPRIATAAGRLTRLPLVGPLAKRALFHSNLTPRSIPILESALAYSGGTTEIKTVKLARRVVDHIKVAKQWDAAREAYMGNFHARLDKMDEAEAAGNAKELNRLGNIGIKNWIDSVAKYEELRLSTRPQIPMLPEEGPLLIETKFASLFSEIKEVVEFMNTYKRETDNDYYQREEVVGKYEQILNRFADQASSQQEAIRALVEVFNYLAKNEISDPLMGYWLSQVLIQRISKFDEIDLELYEEVLLALYIDHRVEETWFELESLCDHATFMKLFTQRASELNTEDPKVKAYAEAWMRVLSVPEEFIEDL